MILVGVIGLLLLLIFGVIIASQIRRGRGGPSSDVSESAPSPTPSEKQPPVAVTAAPETDVDLRVALRNTEQGLFGRLRGLFGGGASPALEDIEEILYTGDLGPTTVQKLLEGLEGNLSRAEKQDYTSIRADLKKQMLAFFGGVETSDLRTAQAGPSVYMIVGVNGAGKTTTIGKLSAQWAEQGKKVLVAAGDTFRAAASAQLRTWTERAQVEIFSPEGISDPGAVAFDAVSKGKAQGFDVVLIDTAGRLHTQAHLMDELKKVKRVVEKAQPDAPHEILIVLDANSGQNALMQAKEFHKAIGLTGAILTKMDGTAKGGVALALACEMKLPIRMIGVGERIRDLRPFRPDEYIDSILG